MVRFGRFLWPKCSRSTSVDEATTCTSPAPEQGLARLARGDSGYPAALIRYLAQDAPAAVTALGNLAILQRQKLALFCFGVRLEGDT